jgi:UDP-N-acetylglucosamine:LPS N-acetylglucosamine transferase
MPENLHHAHEHNDKLLERICIGRRFRNDTERLERLFDRYTNMVAKPGTIKQAKAAPDKKSARKAAA